MAIDHRFGLASQPWLTYHVSGQFKNACIACCDFSNQKPEALIYPIDDCCDLMSDQVYSYAGYRLA